MLAFLLQGLSLGLSAAATPGPYQAFVISRAIKAGWRRTLPAAFSPLITDGPIITLVLFVLTRFPPGFLRIIQLVGGLFVLYMAWKTFQAYRQFRPVEEGQTEVQTRRTLFQAVLMNFLSPGPYIFWSLIAGPILLRSWGQSPHLGLSFLGGFYFALVGGMVLLVVLFGVARRLGARASRWMLGISALALFGFGLYELWQGLFSQM